ncbi:hypothetical protein K438DRAFT_613218 [Mycena galopus ATCC 62051]|nr:hypothetical protein K438DRAFT_613218 [Mycena galopus ATCC 62051]
MGRFEVLSTGVTLVDLPGFGDIDQVRDGMANSYMGSANAICLVNNISRAKDDKEIHQNLSKLLNQAILDKRVEEKSIVLVLTGADSLIGSNEIVLSPEKRATVARLKEEALVLGQSITDLQTKKERKEKSKSKKKAQEIESYVKKITEKREQKESKNKEKNRILTLARSEIVTEGLQETYASLYRDMVDSKAPDVPSITVFCLGTRDYLSLAGLESDSVTIFDDKEEVVQSSTLRLLIVLLDARSQIATSA